MRYKIHHKTIYNYNQPVFLQPHTLRLRPRSNGWQQLLKFTLKVEPEPTGMSPVIDVDGNGLIQLWFNKPMESLNITIDAQVETYINNPFQYVLEPWAATLPIDYPRSLFIQLQPYLYPYNGSFHPIIIELAQQILHEVEGNCLQFLSRLNEQIYQNCQQIFRETGEPWQPSITWQHQQGSCRDSTVLFMEVCRVVGLATRFVSGYQEGDRHQEQRDLHAWAEVYLPGGGWRGYDPTHGLAVANQHITLAASSLPQDAAPVTGQITPIKSILTTDKPLASKMEIHLLIDRAS
jgi:transglutaminase-like putative cysteine protease